MTKSSSSFTKTNNEMNVRKRRSNDGDSGAKYGMTGAAAEDIQNKKLRFHNANNRKADFDNDYDDVSALTFKPIWGYHLKKDIHTILTKDLWRTDRTELHIAHYAFKNYIICAWNAMSASSLSIHLSNRCKKYFIN